MSGFVRPLTYGRMGNFLFQAATAMGYAWRHGLDYTLPTESTKPTHFPVYLQHLAKPQWNSSLPTAILKEKMHNYQELPFQEAWREGNIVLDGYWQTEKYFKEFRPRILEEFGFEWNPLAGFVSVHVRRGDYLRLTRLHPPVSVAWYKTAMARFPGFKFIFFSDDIPWCRETFQDRDDVAFSNNTNEVDDLVEMSWCEHQICSASTFSWWGMYLNRNPRKRVIIPRLWFGPGHANLDTSDIVPNYCERL